MSNNKQSSVEWLISQQKHNQLFDIETIEQANAMHKKEIEKACQEFLDTTLPDEVIKEYYEQTYGGNK
jgi:hypothetical protein